MKFTAQEEYGLRCILQLARGAAREAPGDGAQTASSRTLTVAEVARSEGLTGQYAGKLVSILVKAGLVESVRGRRGGIRLTRPPGAIRIAEVLKALGGDLYESNTCERYTGDRELCVHTSDCAIRSLWAGLQLMVNGVLSKMTLRDLCSNEESISRWMKNHEESVTDFLPIETIHASGERRAES